MLKDNNFSKSYTSETNEVSLSYNGVKLNLKEKIVFMDPPRAGAAEEFLEALCALAPERVVYVSCNPRTQAHDACFNVVGLYFDIEKNGNINTSKVLKAKAIAKKLKIDFIYKNLSTDFENKVIKDFCQNYFSRKTPNPYVIAGVLRDREVIQWRQEARRTQLRISSSH